MPAQAPIAGPGVAAVPADSAAQGERLPDRIHLADYPQLRFLAWSMPGATDVSPEEALSLYERNWRHVDRPAMLASELALLERLIQGPGKGHFLV